MGLLKSNFERFIQLADNLAVLENLLEPAKFQYFLKETPTHGILPNISKQEYYKINCSVENQYSDALRLLKKKVLKEITENDISFVSNYQAETYLNSLELELDSILYCWGKLNLIDEIIENDLYPIPLCLISKKNVTEENPKIKELQELYISPLAKMNAYTFSEKKTYQLLYSLFSYNMKCYDEYKEVLLEIIDIRERRGIGVIPKRELNYCIPGKTIAELHSLLNGKVIESMDCADFMKCFDINNEPPILPSYVGRNKNLMTYTLSLIPSVNDKIAKINFGVTYFNQIKGRKLPNTKRALQNKICALLTKNPISITSK